MVMGLNGAVFITNFFAINKMVSAKFPGFDTGGALWFPNLLVSDPYYALPVISAATLFAVLKVGIEFGGSSEQLSPAMRIGMQWGLPLVVLASSTQFSSVCTLSYF
jgi:YidC/Oxa1 family membrane protein insertase